MSQFLRMLRAIHRFFYCGPHPALLSVVVMSLAFTLSVAAQDVSKSILDASNSRADAVTKQSQASAEVQAPILPAGRLGAEDLVELSVPYCPELSRSFRVTSGGELILPLLSEPIFVKGLEPSEVGALVTKALKRDLVMNDPVVIVSVIEYRSKPVSVVGAVNHPITFQATGETTLLDAIARAGGLSPLAGASILISKSELNSKGAEQKHVTTISSNDLLSSSNAALNITLRGGEEVRVPEAGKVFVAGNVRHPGMYLMQNDGEMSVLKAIALSQGLDQFTSKTAYIYRSQGSGQRQELSVPLSKIIARKDPDVPLRPDDIFYVPESGGKKMTSRVLSQITGFGQNTATGILIYH